MGVDSMSPPIIRMTGFDLIGNRAPGVTFGRDDKLFPD